MAGDSSVQLPRIYSSPIPAKVVYQNAVFGVINRELSLRRFQQALELSSTVKIGWGSSVKSSEPTARLSCTALPCLRRAGHGLWLRRHRSLRPAAVVASLLMSPRSSRPLLASRRRRSSSTRRMGPQSRAMGAALFQCGAETWIDRLRKGFSDPLLGALNEAASAV